MRDWKRKLKLITLGSERVNIVLFGSTLLCRQYSTWRWYTGKEVDHKPKDWDSPTCQRPLFVRWAGLSLIMFILSVEIECFRTSERKGQCMLRGCLYFWSDLNYSLLTYMLYWYMQFPLHWKCLEFYNHMPLCSCALIPLKSKGANHCL